MVIPTVSVVIPTRNRGPLIEQTILSLLASDYSDLSVVVVDQSDNDLTWRTVQRLADADSRLSYYSSRTVGSSIARNEGIRLTRAPYVLFTDDDCVVTPSWVTEMVNELQDPGTWAVFGQVLADEGDRPVDLNNALAPQHHYRTPLV